MTDHSQETDTPEIIIEPNATSTSETNKQSVLASLCKALSCLKHWGMCRSTCFLKAICAVGINLITLVCVALVCLLFNKTFESYFVPSIARIPQLDHDLGLLNAKIETLTQMTEEARSALAHYKQTSQKEIDDLKNAAIKSSDTITLLENKIEKIVAQATLLPQGDKPSLLSSLLDKTKDHPHQEGEKHTSVPKEGETFASSWTVLKQHVEAGEPFADAILSLKQYTLSEPAITQLLDGLKDSASIGIKNFTKLSNELALIKAKLIFGTSPEANGSWWQRFIQRLKSLIRIEKITEPSSQEALVSQDLLTIIESVLTQIHDHKYKEAIAMVKKANLSKCPELAEWLTIAEKRLALQERIEHLDALITPLLSK